MEDGGPSWWFTRPLLKSDRNEDHATLSNEWNCLFEFFPEHGDQYSVLRVSISNGVGAWEQAFSKNELEAKGGGMLRVGNDFLARLLEVVEDLSKDSVHVDEKLNRSAGVSIDFFDPERKLKLNLKLDNELPTTSFVGRIMQYLTYVEAELSQESDKLKKSESRRTILATKLEEEAKAKAEDDSRMITGLEILMEEKRRHWKQNGSNSS